MLEWPAPLCSTSRSGENVAQTTQQAKFCFRTLFATASTMQHDLAAAQNQRLAGLDHAALERRAQRVDGARKHDEEVRHLEMALQVPPRSSKVVWLRKAADSFSAALDRAKASHCKVGCTACCHDVVIVSDAEALMIANDLRLKAHAPKRHYAMRSVMQADDPVRALSQLADQERPVGACPFLKDSRCSIYAHRPLQCRLRQNLDTDDLLCQPVPGRARSAPSATTREHWETLMASLGPDTVLADIRQWFKP